MIGLHYVPPMRPNTSIVTTRFSYA